MKKYEVVTLSLVAVIAAFAIYHFMAANHADSDVATSSAQPATSAQLPPAPSQNPVNAGFPFLDTSVLKPPAGAKVAIYEFEDLECPACANAAPVVHAAAAQHKIPLLRHDYPWSFHIWAFDAAVTARYIEDKLSPSLADAFRRDVFASQARIANKDDLASFTRTWFQSHNQTMPFVMDPNGACKAKVESDRALGDRVGVKSTPCIFVVTQNHFVPVTDISQLGSIIDSAIAGTASAQSEAPAVTGHPS